MKPSKLSLGIGVILFAAAYFVARRPLSPELALVSSISVLLFAAPSYRGVVRFLGYKRGVLLLLSLGIYALVIESLAIHTGFPYGHFTYSGVLGNKIFGLTPWTVAFAYPPILLFAYWTVKTMHVKGRTLPNHKLTGVSVRGPSFHIYVLGLTALVATLVDTVLDPAAVRLGFWYWDRPGFFYGVPLINFLGWLLTGFIGAIILHACVRADTWHKLGEIPADIAYSGMAILWFWTGVNIWLAQWVPAFVGVCISFLLVRAMKHKEATMG